MLCIPQAKLKLRLLQPFEYWEYKCPFGLVSYDHGNGPIHVRQVQPQTMPQSLKLLK